MTDQEKEKLLAAVKKIPCELSVLTYDRESDSSAWIGCKDCSRCLLERALHTSDPLEFIDEWMLKKPDNGGYVLRGKRL